MQLASTPLDTISNPYLVQRLAVLVESCVCFLQTVISCIEGGLNGVLKFRQSYRSGAGIYNTTLSTTSFFPENQSQEPIYDICKVSK